MKNKFSFLFVLATLLSLVANAEDSRDALVASLARTVTFSTTNTYEWKWIEDNGRLQSSNAGVQSSTSTTTIEISAGTDVSTLSFDYGVSSESGCDKLTITLDGTTIVGGISGTVNDSYSGDISASSHKLVLTYYKDSSVNNGEDRAYISNLTIMGKVVLSNNYWTGAKLKLDSDGLLIISGTGDIYGYDYDGYSESYGIWLYEDYYYTYRELVKTAVIRNGITKIGYGTFLGCSNMTSVKIPSSVTSIGYDAFGDCSSLTSVTIPNSVMSIGSSAFVGCRSLTSVTIPSSVTSIGSAAFENCSNVTTLVYADGCTTALATGLRSITSVTIPNSVTSIGRSAFWDCSNLTSIIIPNSVTSIGEYAFYSCM